MLQHELGGVRIHRIIESEEPNYDPLVFFPETTAEDWKPYARWLQPHPKSPVLGYLTLTLQSYPTNTIIVVRLKNAEQSVAPGDVPPGQD